MEDINRIVYRGVQSEDDYPLLLEINLSSRQADNDLEKVTLNDIARVLAHMNEMTPQEGVLIASLADTSAAAIGYSRLGWYSSSADTRLYYQVSFLRSNYRGRGYWQQMVKQNEHRLREVAQKHSSIAQRFFQAWATDKQKDWISVLESMDYQVVRRFNNMLFDLRDIPTTRMPAGFEILPVRPQQMHSIWEAQKEMNDGLFENVAEDWQDDKFPAWLEDPERDPRFWQVAWSGDQLAGMVLVRIDARENEGRERKRGYTEHIYVRPQFRKRGLASALITRSLQVLKQQGMQEAELGVDSENESAAFKLYQKIGYRTASIDTWFRKKIES